MLNYNRLKHTVTSTEIELRVKEVHTDKFKVYESHPKLKKGFGTQTEETSVKRRETPPVRIP